MLDEHVYTIILSRLTCGCDSMSAMRGQRQRGEEWVWDVQRHPPECPGPQYGPDLYDRSISLQTHRCGQIGPRETWTIEIPGPSPPLARLKTRQGTDPKLCITEYDVTKTHVNDTDGPRPHPQRDAKARISPWGIHATDVEDFDGPRCREIVVAVVSRGIHPPHAYRLIGGRGDVHTDSIPDKDEKVSPTIVSLTASIGDQDETSKQVEPNINQYSSQNKDRISSTNNTRFSNMVSNSNLKSSFGAQHSEFSEGSVVRESNDQSNASKKLKTRFRPPQNHPFGIIQEL